MSTYDNPDTPFDALAEEKAQRPTQPLPPRPGSPRARGGKLPVPTGELNDYGDLPEDEDDVTNTAASVSTPQPIPRTPASSGAPLTLIQRLRQTPTEILVGLSVVAGALLVVTVSMAMNALVPKPPLNQDGMVGDLEPQVTVLRDELENPGGVEDNDDVIVEVVPSPEEEILVAESDEEVAEESSTASEDGDAERRSRSRDEDRSPSRERERDAEDKGRTFTHSEKGYRITVPDGFSLRDEGRRTVWRGPDDAQLLVETVSSPDGSPREGWEQLHKNLSRKYGSRYRNLGIRETTLAGRPAAVWEFEITEKNGETIRKIDVGVHHDDIGYAVLGAAPAKKFDELRPQLERAIRSLQLPDKTSRDEPKSTQNTRERERSTQERSTRERRTRESNSEPESKADVEIEGY